MIHELRAAIAHLQRRRARAVPEDPRALQAGAAPADRDVVGAGDADAVGIHGVPRHPRARRRASSRCSTARSSSCSATRTRRCCKVFAHDAAGAGRAARGAGGAEPVRRIPALPGAPRPCGAGRAPASATGRKPHVSDPALLPVFERIYEDTDAHWARVPPVRGPGRPGDAVPAVALPPHAHGDADHRLQARHRRLQSGVGFLKQALELTFFPELFEVRTVIGAPAAAAY